MISVELYVKMGEAMRGVKIRQAHLAMVIECLIFAPTFFNYAALLCHSLLLYTIVGLLLKEICQFGRHKRMLLLYKYSI